VGGANKCALTDRPTDHPARLAGLLGAW